MNIVCCSRQLLRLSAPVPCHLQLIRRLPLDEHRFVKSDLKKNPSKANKMPKWGSGTFASVWQEISARYYDLKDPSAYTVFWRDGVSFRKHLLIYRGDQDRVVLLTFLSMGGVLCILAGIFFCLAPDPTQHDDYDPYDEFDMKWPLYILTTTLFVWVGLGHFICRRYVIRMYYDKNRQEFIGITFNNLMPWKLRKFTCKAGEGKLMTSQYFDWMIGAVKVDAGRFILKVHDFKFPIYYNILMGYQKPDAIDSIRDSTLHEDYRHIHTKKPGFEREGIGKVRNVKDLEFKIQKED